MQRSAYCSCVLKNHIVSEYNARQNFWMMRSLKFFPGSELVVKCTLHELWQNCPRYIHRYKRITQSRYTPDADGKSPLAEWKRIDLLEDVLPQNDKDKVKMLEKLASTIGLKK